MKIYLLQKKKKYYIFKTIIEFIIFFIVPLYKKRHDSYLHKNLIGLEKIHE